MEIITEAELKIGKKMGLFTPKTKVYTYKKVFYLDGIKKEKFITESHTFNPLINPNKCKKGKHKTYYVIDLLAFTLWKRLGRTVEQISNPYYAQFLKGCYKDTGKTLTMLSKQVVDDEGRTYNSYMTIPHEEKDLD